MTFLGVQKPTSKPSLRELLKDKCHQREGIGYYHDTDTDKI